MTSHAGSVVLRYGVAVASVAVGVWVRLQFDPVVGDHMPFPTLFLAVLVTAWYGGLRPSLVAVALAAVASDYYLLQPRSSFLLNLPEEQFGLALFVATGFGISLLAGSMHSARQSAREAADQLETRVRERTEELAIASALLAASEERARLLIDGVRDYAIFMLDAEGNIVFWNSGATRIFGYEVKDALGLHWSRLYRPHDQKSGKPAADLEQARSSGRLETEGWRVREGGSPYWAHVTIAAIRDDSGGVCGFATVTHDETERRAAESRLLDSEAKFRSYIESAPLAVLVADKESRIIECNAQAGTLLGYDRNELLEKSIPDLHPEEDGEDVRTSVERLKSLGTVESEFRMKRRDGEVIWVLLRAVSLGDGQLLAYVQDISERKMAEAELRADRDRFARIVSTVPVVICSFRVRADGSWCFPFASSAIEEIYGFRADDLARDGSAILSRLHPDDVDRLTESIEASMRNLTTWKAEYRVLHPTRGELWIEGHCVPSAEADGSVLWHGYIADVSDWKRADLALRDRERLLALVTGSARVGLVVVGPGYRYVFANEAYAEILGLPHDGIVGRRVPDMLAAGWSQIQPRLDLAFAGVRVSYELTLPPLAVGQPARSYSVVYEPAAEEGAEPTVIVVVVDITERRLAESASTNHRRRLEGIVNSAMDGIITVDGDQQIVLMNSAAERMFAFTADEALGQPLDRLIPNRFRDAHRMLVREFSRTGVAARTMGHFGRIQGVRSDGKEFPIEASISQIDVEGGKLLTVTCRDMTEHVRLAEATRHLEAELQQSQKLEAIGQLAGGVAHDFNNLLTIITGYSDLLLRALPPESPDRTNVEEIRLAGERAAGLTRQLLAFSRRQVLEPKVLDLNSIVTNTEKMLRRLIGEDVEFVSVLQPGMRSVMVDPGQIEQVIMNIALNARDAMPTGGRLTVRTSEVEFLESDSDRLPEVPSGWHVLLSISDTGSGMPPDIAARVFEPFFTTKGVAKGTGLGLAVVHGIVRQSGGLIEVDSEIGVGTTFKVYFPVIDAEGRSESTIEHSTKTVGTETVLLVEDEEGVRRLAAFSLAEFGFRVLTASGGYEAIQIMESNAQDVDIVVTDVVMPGMSGRELVEKLTAIYPSIKVLFVSGYTDDAVVRHGVQQDDVAFLSKPFTPSSLAAKVREVLDQS